MVEASAGSCVYSSLTAVTAKPEFRREARTSASAWKCCRCCSVKGSPSRGRVSSILVSQVRAPGSTTLLITKSFPARLTRDRGVGDGEVHHRVGVEVEDEPPVGPKTARHRGHRQPQLLRGEVVEAVERADRGVEDTFDRQVGERHPAQHHLGAEALARKGQHRLGGVDADDPVAPCDQLAREQAGAAAEIEDGAYAVRVGAPELVEE